MASAELTFKLAWWLRLYLLGIRFMCWLGLEPDPDRVVANIERGVKLHPKHSK